MSEQNKSSEAPEFVVEILTDEERAEKREEMKNIYTKLLSGTKMIENFEAIGEFGQKLRAKYGKVCEYCELFHIMSGSSILPGKLEQTIFDFTAPNSIEDFLRSRGA